jgi:hypothetical protein
VPALGTVIIGLPYTTYGGRMAGVCKAIIWG